jgi:hypothetical protein
MQEAGMEMVYFLCEKIAQGQSTPTKSLYRDVILLDHVAGINLLFSEYPTTNVGDNIRQIVPIYQKEWKQGIYNNPEERIRELCQQLQSKEENKEIEAKDLVQIRRYGIFGLAEIIRQIRDKDSKHAFAAFMIITKQNEYANYIRNPHSQYPTRVEKMNKVHSWYDKYTKKVNSDRSGIMKKIGDVLTGNK